MKLYQKIKHELAEINKKLVVIGTLNEHYKLLGVPMPKHLQKQKTAILRQKNALTKQAEKIEKDFCNLVPMRVIMDLIQTGKYFDL
ncbi:MAG: hypothetical protein H6553_06760 [Chitinophagales bacterium]|nr:hypothetical protein [Chitinophagales bacterium]